MFTPQPGTGCLNVDPQFVNPHNHNFNLQTGSQCCGAGKLGYDLGAKYYTDIPQEPGNFTISLSPDSMMVTLNWTNPTQTVHGNPLDTISAIRIWRNDSIIAKLQVPKSLESFQFTDVISRPNYYRYSLCAVDTLYRLGRMVYGNEMWLGGSIDGIIIWELDHTPITSAALKNSLMELGYTDDQIYITNNFLKYPLESTVRAVFVCLGIYSNNHTLTDEEGLRLKNYLDSGGNVYMEGGDTWYFDPPTPVHPYFEINPIGDGTDDLFNVLGEPGSFCSNMAFLYYGENSFIDRIEPTQNSQRIFYNPSNGYGIAVAYNAGTYRTIGASFELGGLVDGTVEPNTKTELVHRILTFFGITPTQLSTDENLIPEDFTLLQNYPNPFNSSTRFRFGLATSGKVKINIFNVRGQLVHREEMGPLSAGWQEIYWNTEKESFQQVSSGIYFYQFIFQDQKGNRSVRNGKMHLIK
ncbi:MAG: hypothetical protein Kow0042_29400 [Calditrichia bacterium]